ncbi:MAG: DUF2497 domain-containing protein [Alphaproteobacteria bacterium]|nr:DUF2497 domain-containing protein [Alphaproteobacteria bacterium]
MDDIEQDPEEIPMDQVLAEIRQMLSAQTTQTDKVEEPAINQKPEAKPPVPPVIPPPAPTLEKVKPEEPDYFLLTPAMRCDLPPDSELSETVQKQTTRVLNKLQQQSSPELSPALIEWLNANLPAMIEKVLANHSKLGG